MDAEIRNERRGNLFCSLVRLMVGLVNWLIVGISWVLLTEFAQFCVLVARPDRFLCTKIGVESMGKYDATHEAVEISTLRV
jgi:hypothetical protein